VVERRYGTKLVLKVVVCTVVDVTVGPVVVGVRRCGIKLEVGTVDVDGMVVVCSVVV